MLSGNFFFFDFSLMTLKSLISLSTLKLKTHLPLLNIMHSIFPIWQL